MSASMERGDAAALGAARAALRAGRRHALPAAPHPLAGRRLAVVAVALPLALVASCVLAVGVGAAGVPVDSVIRSIGSRLLPGAIDPPLLMVDDQVVWELRAPRVVLAALAGVGLSVAGAVLQAVVRNPLAEPYVLGVAGGASFGAVLAIVGGAAVAGIGVGAAAFAGAAVATAAVFALGRRGGQIAPVRLVLAGVAIAALFNAATSYLQLRADPFQVQAVLTWLFGSVAGAQWSDLPVPAVVVAVATAWLLARWRALNAILVGDDAARSLGVEVDRLRAELLVATSLLVGAVVSVAGGIAFVGLVVPHVVRLLVGADHRRVLALSALVGALYLVWVDALGRVLAAPGELPLGILTAALGGPFFLWLLRRSGKLDQAGTGAA